jgi:hypothetical protein
MPAAAAALLAEYERCTNRVVRLDHMRVEALFILVNRDVTPDQIFDVVRYVKKRIRAGDNKRGVGMFKEASLEFMNLLGDAGRFQDRLITARTETISRRAHKGKLVPVTRAVSDGDTITRLEPEPHPDAVPVRAALASFFSNLATQMKGEA